MATRFMTALQISEGMNSRGYFKPGGTMGAHHLTAVNQGTSLIVIGNVSGRVVLRDPADVVGYDCGTIWPVRRPEEHKDPIRKVLAQVKISQRLLKYSDAPISLSGSWAHTWQGNSGSGSSDEIIVLGESTTVRLNSDSFGGGDNIRDTWDEEVSGGECIVRVRKAWGCWTGGGINAVYVRTGADKQKVAAWLYRNFVPEGIAKAQKEAEAIIQELLSVSVTVTDWTEKPHQEVWCKGEIHTIDESGVQRPFLSPIRSLEELQAVREEVLRDTPRYASAKEIVNKLRPFVDGWWRDGFEFEGKTYVLDGHKVRVKSDSHYAIPLPAALEILQAWVEVPKIKAVL